jgi:hypothetical protein
MTMNIDFEGSGKKTMDDNPVKVRKGEGEKHWFRSDRFFKVGNDWFFTTREQKDVGPFTSQSEAEHGLGLFVECLTQRDTDIDYAIHIATRGDWAVTGFQ